MDHELPPSYRVNAPTVVSEEIQGEVIIIHFDSGHYYSLTGAGAWIWNQLEAGFGTPLLIQQLAVETGRVASEIAGELDSFVTQLVKEKLLVPKSDVPDAASLAKPSVFGGSYVLPELSRYTDMQELLMVDPIHEVGEAGWPMLRPPGQPAPQA